MIHTFFSALHKLGIISKRDAAIDSALAELVVDEAALPPGGYKAWGRPSIHKAAFTEGWITHGGMPPTGYMDTPPQAVDEFRRLRDHLLLANAGREMKTIAVCKANAGEGSSLVACHLALAFAEDPRLRLVLVDSDLRHPGLHTLLGVGQDGGLHEILAEGAATTKEHIKSTLLHNLHVITSGAPLNRQSIISAPETYTELLENLKAEFSIVIVDTPPTLACDTALAVAAKCDGVIFVVQAERTRWESAREAQTRLQRAGAKFLGAVLNKRTYPIPDFLYRRL